MHSSAARSMYHHVIPATSLISEALGRIGATEADFQWPSLELAPGEQRVLCAPDDGLYRRTLATRSRADLELWLGVKIPDLQPRDGLYEFDVDTGDHITLTGGSRLILVGRPVLFVANQIIFSGGEFVSTCDGYYAFGEVRHA
jgi:hypothetical protein